MQLKDIYIEIGKSIAILITLYIPAMMVEGNVNFQLWSVYTQITLAVIYTYFQILIYDFVSNEKVTVNAKVYKSVKSNLIKVKVAIVRDWNRLRQWH